MWSVEVSDQDEASIVRAIRVQTVLNIIGVSLLFFDHLFVTFGAEISFIWTRPKAASAYWFFLNRYIAFFGNIIVLALGYETLPETSCEAYNSFRQALLVICQALICILLLIRTYALYALNVRILIFLVTTGVILLAVVIWAMITQSNSNETRVAGCYVNLSTKSGIHLATVWEMVLVFDALIFVLTVLRTYRTRPRNIMVGDPTDLTSLFFRDGALYFVVMALANLANILTFYLAGPLLKGSLSGISSSISVTMMSRLILNLHKLTARGLFTDNVTTLDFNAQAVILPTNAYETDDDIVIHGNISRNTSSGIELQDFGSRRLDHCVS